ncbi:MAG: hypothetical protein U0903_04305 [Planctomycetales bacterium]
MSHFRCLIPTVLGLAAVANSAAAAETATRDAGLILFAPRHPVFLRLTSSVDSKPLTDVRKNSVQKLAALLDKNEDGFVSKEEWATLSTWGDRSPDSQMSETWWKQADLQPADGKLSPEEFEILADLLMGKTLRLEFPPPRQTQAVDLFKFLDQNGDGLVSAAELAAGSKVLNRYDLNEDGSVAIEELLPPGMNPASLAQGGSSTAETWFLIPESEQERKDLVKRLLTTYDRLPAGKPDGALDHSESGLSATDFAKFDLDKNSRLDESEFLALLANPPGEVAVTLQLSAREFRRPKMTLQQAGAPPSTPGNTSTNQTDLVIDSIPIDVGVRGTRITPYDARQFYRSRFRQVDADKNQYLNEQEFLGLQLPMVSFKQVDRDNDGQLFDKELVAYLDQHLLITGGRLTVIVTNDSKSLMEILDKDNDRRLSPREFRQSGEVLKSFDQNRDGFLAPSELTVRQKVVFEYNRSPLLEVAANALNTPTATRSRTRETLSGPIWFQRMDRNRDGDVTLKEFLGPLESFEKLDLNHDGAIDEQEAESAKP